LPQPNTVTVMQAEHVARILSEREGKTYKFFRFLNLSRLTYVFTTEDGEQKVLAEANLKNILKGDPA